MNVFFTFMMESISFKMLSMRSIPQSIWYFTNGLVPLKNKSKQANLIGPPVHK
jgi:hypothetical protein